MCGCPECGQGELEIIVEQAMPTPTAEPAAPYIGPSTEHLAGIREKARAAVLAFEEQFTPTDLLGALGHLIRFAEDRRALLSGEAVAA